MQKININKDWEFEKEGVKSVVSLPHTWNVTKKRILCQYARLNPHETLGYRAGACNIFVNKSLKIA